MKTRINFYTIQQCFTLICFVLVFPACNNFKENDQRLQDFNGNWRFIEKDLANAMDPNLDDSAWRIINLPHDWSVEDFLVQDSLHIGPFFKQLENGEDVGYLRGGTGWYRKKFSINEKNKIVFLHFDGIQTECELWVNGQFVGEHFHGYTPFYYNISPFLNDNERENVLAIKVSNPEQNSRWFAGAGIYRDVKISLVDPLHIKVWGLGIITREITTESALISVDVNLMNQSDQEREFEIRTTFLTPANKIIKGSSEKVSMIPGEEKAITLNQKIVSPQLWDIDSPNLYTIQAEILQNGTSIDAQSTKFGIRSIEFSATEGFKLNGNTILLKGACMHHDNGLLGAAAFKRAEERRVLIMKENGFNAIRTSHNPPSNAFLEACDKYGMLVIDEFVDMWLKPKRPNDYHQYFKHSWEGDLRNFVLRDRNHPSIIMWSYGNEIQERADSAGLVIAEDLIKTIKSIDDSRPVTQAVNGVWDNPDKTWVDMDRAFALMDIGGYNYRWVKYESDHERVPTRIIVGTETLPREIDEAWSLVEKHPYVIGDFVWTGMDYIGESGIGHTNYLPIGDSTMSFYQPWPWYISWCGDIDIIGNRKPQIKLRDVVWGRSKLEFAVHEPIPDGMHELHHYWGWAKEFQSWNWTGFEGKPLMVNVYSSYPTVQVELNGRLLEEKALNDSIFSCSFEVPYEKGILNVNGIKDGEIQEIKSIQTTGNPTFLKLLPECREIGASTDEIVFIKVEIRDEEDRLIPLNEDEILVKVSGVGSLLAAGNGGPVVQGSIQDEVFKLYNGRGIIIVRSDGLPGEITVEARCNGLKTETTRIVVL